MVSSKCCKRPGQQNIKSGRVQLARIARDASKDYCHCDSPVPCSIQTFLGQNVGSRHFLPVRSAQSLANPGARSIIADTAGSVPTSICSCADGNGRAAVISRILLQYCAIAKKNQASKAQQVSYTTYAQQLATLAAEQANNAIWS